MELVIRELNSSLLSNFSDLLLYSKDSYIGTLRLFPLIFTVLPH